MILLTPNLIEQYKGLRKRKDCSDFIESFEERVYTVKDSVLTYRQINSLDNDEMLVDSRDKSKGWRKFSIKDLTYLQCIHEARKYNLTNEQLQNLKHIFYDKDFYKNLEKQHSVTNPPLDILFLSVIGTVKIYLVITSEGYVYFSDINSFAYLMTKHDSFVYFNFNEIVIEAIKKSGIGIEVSYYKELSEYIEEMNEKLTQQEKEIINIIRDSAYKQIKIKKNIDKSYTVYGEENNTDKALTELDLINQIKSKNYSNVQITKRDGKIVNMKLEDVYKV
ncbi:hypothetical protein GF362_03175 [Candidatus Dojkabacteria bacterium]|nr:hypothetical protein [Candidatus Dojkabacteria bacterium]